MSTKLYVGNLTWTISDEALHEAFGRFGEVVEAKVIRDRDTGRSRGFGFVTFADADVAQSAISAMDNSELDGRTIRVNLARDKGPQPGGGRGGRDGGGGMRSRQ